jgi:RNA polymerase sigma-70 factor (ECF subfamily)
MKAAQGADIASLLAHAGWLRRFALALVRDADEAEDLAQDTMLSAWRHPMAGAERGWLSPVARNLAVDRFRASRRRQGREHATESLRAGRVATPEELIGDAQIHKQVAEVVVGLSEPFRQAIVLRFYEGRSSADIARELAVPEGTVRWRVKEGLERVRRKLDAQHGNDRSAWVAALAPLVPQPLPGGPPQQPNPVQAPVGLSGTGYVAMAVLGASVLALAIVSVVARTRRTPTLQETEASTPMTATESAPLAGAVPIFNLTSLTGPATEEGGPLAPGPGRADAQTLVEELLEAIEGNDYDAFVAKGSAPFRAALPTRGFASVSATLGHRLAQGHRVSLFGSVRRTNTLDWLFKLELADGGDDGLVTLAMDGWQVAGFLVDAPTTPPAEK